MSGVGIKIDIQGAEDIAKGLQRLYERSSDLSEPLRGIGASLLLSTQRRFEMETGPDGNSWKKSYGAIARGGSTLRESGDLYNTLTYNVSGNTLEVGTNKIYAAIHQLGGKTGRGHSVEMPARPFLGLDDDDREEIFETINDYIINWDK